MDHAVRTSVEHRYDDALAKALVNLLPGRRSIEQFPLRTR